MTVNELVSQLQALQQDGHGEREIDWQYEQGSLEIEGYQQATAYYGQPLLVINLEVWRP